MDNFFQTLRFRLQIAQRTTCHAKNWGAENECIPFSKLYYIEAGEGWVSLQGRRIELTAGKLLALPAFVPQGFGTDKSVTIQWAHFTATFPDGLGLIDYLGVTDVLPQEMDVIALMGQLRQIYRHRDQAHRLFELPGVLRLLLSPFVAASNPAHCELRRQGRLRFQPVLDFIEANLHRRISVGELATIAELDQAHFSREFRNHLDLPPAQYIRQRKIQAAQHLLWSSDDRLASIAQRLGFVDEFHFSRTFHQVTGLRPSAFRNQPRGET